MSADKSWHIVPRAGGHDAEANPFYATMAVLGLGALTRTVAADRGEAPRLQAVPATSCAELATDPANGLAGNPAVKSATSRLVPASGANVAYCQVNLVYGTNPDP